MDGWTGPKIPVGDSSEAAINWVIDKFGFVFDWISAGLDGLISGIGWPLLEVPALVVILAFVALCWYLQRSWKPSVLVAICFLYIVNQGYWERTMQTLALIVASCVVCMVAGVAIGVYCAHRPRFYSFLLPILDMMQTLPTLVYLIPMIYLFGIGSVPGLIATVIYVLPVPIRLTQLGISGTPIALGEAATAFGATPRQKLWKVEIPFAIPQIMTAVNQTILQSLSMVVLAAYVGTVGLGQPVISALGKGQIGAGFEAGFVIVALAIALAAMFGVEQKK